MCKNPNFLITYEYPFSRVSIQRALIVSGRRRFELKCNIKNLTITPVACRQCTECRNESVRNINVHET